jgi:prepilin-type N-terminal cleavage/methylation domain-containing protein
VGFKQGIERRVNQGLYNKQMKNKQGFTLIELLVVVAIIGLLASVIVVSLGNARQKSRDARRLTDIQQIKSGLDIYFTSGGGYPSTATWTAAQSAGTGMSCSATPALNKVPQDLFNSANPGFAYVYEQVGNSYSGCGTTIYLDYQLEFQTEAQTSLGAAGYYCLRPTSGITAGACP